MSEWGFDPQLKYTFTIDHGASLSIHDCLKDLMWDSSFHTALCSTAPANSLRQPFSCVALDNPFSYTMPQLSMKAPAISTQARYFSSTQKLAYEWRFYPQLKYLSIIGNGSDVKSYHLRYFSNRLNKFTSFHFIILQLIFKFSHLSSYFVISNYVQRY